MQILKINEKKIDSILIYGISIVIILFWFWTIFNI